MLPVAVLRLPGVRDSVDCENVERQHDIPAQHCPLAIIQRQGLLQRILELNIFELLLCLLRCQHHFSCSISSNSGLCILLLV